MDALTFGELKARAFAAEAKLERYRALAEAARDVLAGGNAVFLEQALESVDDDRPIRDFFNQDLVIDENGRRLVLPIRERAGLEHLSELNEEEIRVAAERSTEEKLVGVLFQLLQVTDMGAAIVRKRNTACLDADHLHLMASDVARLLVSGDFLHPALGVSIERLTKTDG